MNECDILGGQNILWPPNASWSRPLADAGQDVLSLFCYCCNVISNVLQLKTERDNRDKHKKLGNKSVETEAG